MRLPIGGIVMALRMNARLSLLLVVILPLMVGFIAVVVRRAVPLFRALQVKLDGINRVMRETLAGIRVIRAFDRTAYEERRFAETYDDLTATTLRVTRLFALMMPSVILILNLSTVAVIWFGSIQVGDGEIYLYDGGGRVLWKFNAAFFGYGGMRMSRGAAKPAQAGAPAPPPADGEPFFLQQPEGTNRPFVGSRFSLGASVGGSGPLSLQWQFDGESIPGGTNSDLIFDPVGPASLGHRLGYPRRAAGHPGRQPHPKTIPGCPRPNLRERGLPDSNYYDPDCDVFLYA